MLKTTANNFVLETNSNLFLSAGKLSGRSQLIHFRKNVECLLVVFFIVSQVFLGFKFNQQLIWSLIGAFRLAKRICGNNYF